MAERILIVNVHSHTNAGDAALTLETLGQLQDMFPGCEISLAMDDPSSHYGSGAPIGSFFSWVKRDGKWRWFALAGLLPATLLPILTHRLLGRGCYFLTPRPWRRLLMAYTGADLVVSKPGGFMYSSGRGVSLLIALYTLWLAVVAGKPVYMYPQSVGPLSRKWECLAVGYVLLRLRNIAVREPISLQQLTQCGIAPERCQLFPDTAFAFDGICGPAAVWLREQGIPEAAGPLLGLTTVNWSAQNPRFTGQETYESACAEAIRAFVRRYDGIAVIFPQVTGPLPSQDDRVSARRVFNRVRDLGERVCLVEMPVRADVLRTVYGSMDVFVGTRMHSNIFAMSALVPTLAIGYQPKTRGITSVLGLERWSIDIEAVDGKNLVALLDQLWGERQAVHEHLARVMPRIRERALLPGKLIKQDYVRFTGAT